MSSPRPIPEALLERYLAGELSADEKQALEQRMSPEDQARLAALKADGAAFMVKHPPGPTVAKLESASAPRRPWWTLVLAPALAVAAALLFFVWQRPIEPELGIKGDLALAVYRQTAQGSERLEAGATLAAGDRVRFEVRAPRDGYVAILSRDAAGDVTVYYPYQGTAAAKYRTSEALLPGAIGLDETRGTEDVWAVYGKEPFELQPYLEQLKKGAGPSGIASARVSWTKK